MLGGAEAGVGKQPSWGPRGTTSAGGTARLLDRMGIRPLGTADGGLRHARRRMVRVAIWIGFASTVAVAVATALPHHEGPGTNDGAVYALAAIAAAANAVFGILALRWRERQGEDVLLVVWGVALVGLVAALTYAGGGYSSDYYLLEFLAISFVAATQRPRAQASLFVLLVAGYAVAVVAAPGRLLAGNLVLRLGVLAGAEVLGWYLAAMLRAEAGRRARLQAESELKEVLAVEANHRIKNNLQLVADLLSLEASKPQASLPGVVDVTLGRVQAVAAVHALLSSSGDGQIHTRSVLESVVRLLTERIGAQGPVEARVEGSFPDLDPQRATWLAVAVNELATNAILHGLGASGGTLVVRLEEGPGWRVVVADDGAGAVDHAEGLGLSLVRRLVEDGLGGRLHIDADGSGTRAEIVFEAAP